MEEDQNEMRQAMGRKRDKKRKEREKEIRKLRCEEGREEGPDNDQNECVEQDTGKILSSEGTWESLSGLSLARKGH